MALQAAERSGPVPESLIGSILHEDEAEQATAAAAANVRLQPLAPAAPTPSLLQAASVHGPLIHRSTSAPPQLAALDGEQQTFLAALKAQAAGGGALGDAASRPARGSAAAAGGLLQSPGGAAAVAGRAGGDSAYSANHRQAQQPSAADAEKGSGGGAAADADADMVVVNGETVSASDPRLSPEYYAYYYLQRPLDPRLPPPLFNWSSWHYANSHKLQDPARLQGGSGALPSAQQPQPLTQQTQQRYRPEQSYGGQLDTEAQAEGDKPNGYSAHHQHPRDSSSSSSSHSAASPSAASSPAQPASSSFFPSASHRAESPYNEAASVLSSSPQVSALDSPFLSSSPASILPSSFSAQSHYLAQRPGSYLSLSPASSPLTEPLDSFELQKQFQAISLAQEAHLDAQHEAMQAAAASQAFAPHPATNGSAASQYRGGAGGGGMGGSNVSPMLAVMGFGAVNGQNAGAGGGGGGGGGQYQQHSSSHARANGFVPSAFLNGFSHSLQSHAAHDRPPLASSSPSMFLSRPSHALNGGELPAASMSLGLQPMDPFAQFSPLNLALAGMGGMSQMSMAQAQMGGMGQDPRLAVGYGAGGMGGGQQRRGSGQYWDATGDAAGGRPRGFDATYPSQHHATHHGGSSRHYDRKQQQQPQHRAYHPLLPSDPMAVYDDRQSPLLPFAMTPALSPQLLSLPPPKFVPAPPMPPPPSSHPLLSPRGLASTAPLSSSATSPAHSAWMEDFRLNKSNSHLSLFDIAARSLVLDLATDQFGSRFIQQRLETATAAEREAAFTQLLPEVVRLSEDVFGNYVVQKFLEHGTAEQRRAIALGLAGRVHALSLQMYGCRVVQKAIDVNAEELQAAMVRELNGHVMQLVRDSNGNHVIQKCIERCPPHVICFITEAFSGQVCALSTHPYGCRVIQRLLEHCEDGPRLSLLSELMQDVEALSRNSYANYVVQHVLIHGSSVHRSQIVASVRGRLLSLSKHKFASNVVEKCFAHASKQDRDALVDEVLGREATAQAADSSNSVLIAMVKDQYANYVIQRLIDVLDDEQRHGLVLRIRKYVPSLKKIPYGKHILAKIEKLTGQQL